MVRSHFIGAQTLRCPEGNETTAPIDDRVRPIVAKMNQAQHLRMAPVARFGAVHNIRTGTRDIAQRRVNFDVGKAFVRSSFATRTRNNKPAVDD
tara:strand:+ start:793 stop:1074 length:282 start_codon:yes stop_codon:yes gene_type:complete